MRNTIIFAPLLTKSKSIKVSPEIVHEHCPLRVQRLLNNGH